MAVAVAMAGSVQAAEPLTSQQRNVQQAGSIARVAIPAGALLLTWVVGPKACAQPCSESNQWLLMGGSPRHDLLLALGRTWVITTGLKYSMNETRPNGGPRSFPSGHTSMAFTGAEFIRREYSWRWAIPAYLAAGFVGWSRVEARNHYAHDVVAGAALGILANHDFWVRHAEGRFRLSATALESGRRLAPGLRLDWVR